ncbi:hypothetical protein [Paenibacillus sp. Cedars]|uniref:hypothetical protein n=1 Tax=Paenibacillus sp. Cedars TaxID=1980674 RepID=UPI001561C06E|nr:hypothetical protein [Paenibacillus sp. Cedars]
MLFVTLLVASLWPIGTDAFNPYILLVFSIIAGKAAYRLPAIQACVIGIVLVVGAIMLDLLGYPGFPSPFLVRYSVILAIGLALFRTVWARYEESSVRNETLLSEYRNMKRRMNRIQSGLNY